MGVDASATPPSPRSCATPTTSPTASTCAATSSSRRGSPRPRSTRPRTRWTVETDEGDRVIARFVIMATGLPVLAQHAQDSRAWRLQGPDLPHRQLAARRRRLHRQDGRRDRHRLVGDPVDPDHRPAGQARSPCSSARPTTPCRRTTRRSIRTTCSEVKAELPGHAQARQEDADRHRLRLSTRPRRSRRAEASAQREFEERWDHGGLGFLALVLRPAAERRVEQDGGGVRARQDPRGGEGSRARRAAAPQNIIGCKRLCVDIGY